jgi:hypothetical protein
VKAVCSFAALGVCLFAAGSVMAQQAVPAGPPAFLKKLVVARLLAPAASVTPVVRREGCYPWKFQAAAGELTFSERACYYGSKLSRPSLALRGVALAGLGQWRNSPDMHDRGAEAFGERLGMFYARHTAQSGAELLVGYWHHEDPRPHVSTEHGVWRRVGSAALSVVQVQDADGGRRIALAPASGALASGMVSAACCRVDNSVGRGLVRSGFVFGADFGTAIAREFKPDLTALALRILHQR